MSPLPDPPASRGPAPASIPPPAERGPSRPPWRLVLAAALLLAQVGAIAYARFTPLRYFCWAPYDEITVYRIEARLGDRELSEEEIRRRYGIKAAGRDNRSSHHILHALRQAERTRERLDPAARAELTVTYWRNGLGPHTWRYPE